MQTLRHLLVRVGLDAECLLDREDLEEEGQVALFRAGVLEPLEDTRAHELWVRREVLGEFSPLRRRDGEVWCVPIHSYSDVRSAMSGVVARQGWGEAELLTSA